MCTKVCVACVALLAFGGCGGSSIDFPIDGNKQLDELTDADARAICREMRPMFGLLDDLMCTSRGISKSSTGEGSCQAIRDQCLHDDSFSTEVDCDTATINELGDCEATVAEYETCASDTYSMLKSLMSKIHCGASPADLQALETQYKLPASCEALNARCPSIDMGIGS